MVEGILTALYTKVSGEVRPARLLQKIEDCEFVIKSKDPVLEGRTQEYDPNLEDEYAHWLTHLLVRSSSIASIVGIMGWLAAWPTIVFNVTKMTAGAFLTYSACHWASYKPFQKPKEQYTVYPCPWKDRFVVEAGRDKYKKVVAVDGSLYVDGALLPATRAPSETEWNLCTPLGSGFHISADKSCIRHTPDEDRAPPQFYENRKGCDSDDPCQGMRLLSLDTDLAIQGTTDTSLNIHTRGQDRRKNAEAAEKFWSDASGTDNDHSVLENLSTHSLSNAEDLNLEPYVPLESFSAEEELACFKKGIRLRVSLLACDDTPTEISPDDFFCDPAREIHRLAQKRNQDTRKKTLAELATCLTTGLSASMILRRVNEIVERSSRTTTLDECFKFLEPNLKMLHGCRSLGIESGSSLRSLPTFIPNQINADFMDYAVTGNMPQAPDVQEQSCFPYFIACMELEVAQDRIARTHKHIYDRLDVVANYTDRVTMDMRRTIWRINDALSVFGDAISVVDILQA